MKKKHYIIISVIAAIVIIIVGSQFIFAKPTYDNFAKCLTEEGATFYGTEWCPHCQDQKTLFGSSMKYVNYIDCDLKRELCLKDGIEVFPTWRFSDRDPLTGTQQFKRLSSITGCELKTDG